MSLAEGHKREVDLGTKQPPHLAGAAGNPYKSNTVFACTKSSCP